MTDKDLRHMSRRELVELIYEMKLNEEELRGRLEQAERKLAERELKAAQAGSLAEAALAINGVFEAAQAAADDYLRAVRQAASHTAAPAEDTFQEP